MEHIRYCPCEGEYLVQQPAHICCRELESSNKLQLLCVKNGMKTHLEFNTVTLPTRPVSFRTQFRTHQGLRREPTGSELAENELHRQQVMVHENEVADNKTWDVIVLQEARLST